jgi:hypothetical protein
MADALDGAALIAHFTAPARLNGTSARVRLFNVSAVTTDAQVRVTPASGATEGLEVIAPADFSSQGGLESSPTRIDLRIDNFTSLLYVFLADCGAPWGERPFACAPGSEGAIVTFSCPVAQAAATCLSWDVASLRWSPTGCAVRDVSDMAVTCACDHVSDFAVRFASVEAAEVPIYTGEVIRSSTAQSPQPWVMGVTLGVISAAFLLCLWIGSRADRRADASFVAALRSPHSAVSRSVQAASSAAVSLSMMREKAYALSGNDRTLSP